MICMEGRVPHCPVERARVLGLCISCSRRPPQVGARAVGVALPFRIYADSRRGTWPVVWDRSTIHARARLDDGIGVANCRPTHARVTGGLRGGQRQRSLLQGREVCFHRRKIPSNRAQTTQSTASRNAITYIIRDYMCSLKTSTHSLALP